MCRTPRHMTSARQQETWAKVRRWRNPLQVIAEASVRPGNAWSVNRCEGKCLDRSSEAIAYLKRSGSVS